MVACIGQRFVGPVHDRLDRLHLKLIDSRKGMISRAAIRWGIGSSFVSMTSSSLPSGGQPQPRLARSPEGEGSKGTVQRSPIVGVRSRLWLSAHELTPLGVASTRQSVMASLAHSTTPFRFVDGRS